MTTTMTTTIMTTTIAKNAVILDTALIYDYAALSMPLPTPLSEVNLSIMLFCVCVVIDVVLSQLDSPNLIQSQKENCLFHES